MPDSQRTRLAIGLMSGTSLDGIDAALVQLGSDHSDVKCLESTFLPYSEDLRNHLFSIANSKSVDVENLVRISSALAIINADAVNTLLAKTNYSSGDISVIGYHGQTIAHFPQPKMLYQVACAGTLQIGCSSTLAEQTGIPVVSNFRSRDIAAGGQGAPLVPYFDYLIFEDSDIGRVILNLGGIANATLLPAAIPQEEVIAFDFGPGNSLIDIWIQKVTNGEKHFDTNGEFAAGGVVDNTLLEAFLDHEYFSQKPPKSTGRDVFGEAFLHAVLSNKAFSQLPSADIMATLVEVTVRSIVDALNTWWNSDKPAEEIIVSGGGLRNDYLISRLSTLLPHTKISSSSAYGIDPDFKEAIAFACLADRTIRKLPGNLPSATGAKRNVILGDITFA